MNGLAKYQTLDLSAFSWQTAPANLCLDENEVHVWHFQLDQDNLAEFEPIISADEQKRANRFRFEKDRNRFIVGRGILRKIIGNYLQIKPSQVQFSYHQFGKPFLDSNLKFNLSHSGNFALLAITQNWEIGIDIEQTNPHFIDNGVISLCLTEIEKAHFYALFQNAQIEFFFDCWTKKEAYLKANGFGLSVSPNKIETSQLPQSNFTFPTLPIIDGYSSALAIEGNNPPINFQLIAINTQ